MGSCLPDIFLSYSREDKATARRFADAFEREGLSVWWDATLNPGEAFDEVTEKALVDAWAVVVQAIGAISANPWAPTVSSATENCWTCYCVRSDEEPSPPMTVARMMDTPRANTTHATTIHIARLRESTRVIELSHPGWIEVIGGHDEAVKESS